MQFAEKNEAQRGATSLESVAEDCACAFLSAPKLAPIINRSEAITSCNPTHASGLCIGFAFTGLVSFTLFGFVFWRLGNVWSSSVHSDFAQHLKWVDQLLTDGHLLPHPLYHLLTALTWKLSCTSLETAGYFTVPVLLSVITACSVFVILFKSNPKFGRGMPLMMSFFALGLSVLGPINFWSWPEHLYLGFFSATVYHNPTYLVLKPLALLLFFQLTVVKPPSMSRFATLCALTIACGMAKPNFNLVLLIVLGGLSVYNLIRHRSLRVQPDVLSVVVPAVFVLAWQFKVAYQTPTEEGSRIIFAPFLEAMVYSNHVFLKSLTSIAFPLLVLVLYFNQARSYAPLRLAWLSFGCSILLFFLLAEDGPRKYHANFAWGVHICTFILFVASVMFLLKPVGEGPETACCQKDARLRPCICLGVLHVLCGLAFYLLTFNLHHAATGFLL
jgi:hypothetical protein